MSEKPLVVLALKVQDVRLGDITDHLGGRLRVREIVQRAHEWDLAGDPPDHYLPAYTPPQPPLARRSLPKTDTVRVWRTLGAIGPVRGHGRRIERSDLVARGWYRFYTSHTAGCSCGWRDATTHTDGSAATNASAAEAAWTRHKAAALTDAAYQAQPALRLVTELQDAQEDLTPVPWTFGPVYNGPAAGGGMARGRLDGLPVESARTAMAGWANALGVDDVQEYRYPARQGPRGWRPPRTELTVSAYGGERALVELSALIKETTPAPESDHGVVTVPWEPDGDGGVDE